MYSNIAETSEVFEPPIALGEDPYIW